MDDFKTYRKRPTTIQARPYVQDEPLTGVSVSPEDQPQHTGGMVARNPEHHEDQWFINAEYWAQHYEQDPV